MVISTINKKEVKEEFTKTGERSKKTELTGRSPLRRGRSVLRSSVVEEEEEEEV
jgi:hypothetical protein